MGPSERASSELRLSDQTKTGCESSSWPETRHPSQAHPQGLPGKAAAALYPVHRPGLITGAAWIQRSVTSVTFPVTMMAVCLSGKLGQVTGEASTLGPSFAEQQKQNSPAADGMLSSASSSRIVVFAKCFLLIFRWYHR